MNRFVSIVVPALLVLVLTVPASSQWVTCTGGGNVTCFAVRDTIIVAGSGSPTGVWWGSQNSTMFQEHDSGLPLGGVNDMIFHGDTLYAAVGSHGIYFTSDNGSTWHSLGLSVYEVVGLAFSGSQFIAATTADVRSSTDMGATWIEVGYTGSFGGLRNFGSINFLLGNNGLYRSSDDGATWKERDSLMSNTDLKAVVAAGSNFYAVTYGGGAYRSTDNGDSWTGINNGFGGALPAYMSGIVAVGPKLFASNHYGVYVSTDEGDSWHQMDDGISDSATSHLATCGTGLFAALQNNSIQRYSLSQVLSVPVHASAVPKEFALLQNYPNPFNPTTTISFTVSKAEHASVTVFDAIGRQLTKLFDGSAQPGKQYELHFDASGLPSGDYFYRIDAGGLSQTKHMELIK